MAITGQDQALAGMQYPREFGKAVTGTLVAGRPHSLFYLAGFPGAAAAPSPGIGGAHLTSYPGQLNFTNPVSGNTHLARFHAQAGQAGTLMLCDRLWHNSSITITSTSEQTFTGATRILARDALGTNNGVGVLAAVEVSTLTGSGTPILTLKYTDSDGVVDKTATNIMSTVAASIAGSFYPIGLAAGGNGIRIPQSLTLNATWTSGTIHVVLYRVIARLPLTAAGVPNAINPLTGGMTRMHDNTVPFLVFVPSTTTSVNIMGHAIFTQG